MNTAAFSIKDAIGFGWAMVKEKFWFLVAIIFISGFFTFLPDVTRAMTNNKEVLFFVQVISIVLGFVIDAGLIYVILRLYDGKVTKVKDVFSQYPIAFRYFVANVLYVLITVGLLILFISYQLYLMDMNHSRFLFNNTSFLIILLVSIPCIYLMLRYQFYKYYLVDKNVDIVDSFKESTKITEGKKWQLLRFALAIICLNILGLLAFVIGLFVTVPMSMFATVYVYRKLSTPITEPELIEETPIVLESLDQNISIDDKLETTSL